MLPSMKMARLANQLSPLHTCQRPLTFAYLSRSYEIRRHVLLLCKRNLSIATRHATKCDTFGERPFTLSCLWTMSHKRQSSSLYISDKIPTNSYFEFDHDLEKMMDDLEKVKQNVRIRGKDIDVDALVRDYKTLAELKQQKRDLKQAQKITAKQYKKLATTPNKSMSGEARQSKMRELAEEGRQTKKAKTALMAQWYEVHERMILSTLELPNDTLPSVPEQEFEVLQEFNTDQKFNSDVDHMDIMRDRKWVKPSNLGPRSYFLTGRLAVLEQELLHQFTISLSHRGLTQLSSPDMFKATVVESAGFDIGDSTQVYTVDTRPEFIQDGMFLHGSSRMSFLAFFARMILKEDQLPLKLFNVGRNNVPDNEARSRLPGLYGALQSMKVDLCGVSRSREENTELFQHLQHILTDIYKDFNLPFRLVSMPVTSLMVSEQNRIELQVWVPSLQRYIKVASLSSLGEYSSRRLMVRCTTGDVKHTRPVHTVHGEVADIMTLIAILVEYDQELSETENVLRTRKHTI